MCIRDSKSRADAKLNQSRCFGALQRYLFYGGDFIRRTTLTDPALQALTSEQLLAKIGGLMGKQHEVLYLSLIHICRLMPIGVAG